MKISVIVPFLNGERYLEQCIQALLDQDFPRDEYELIFVDNGSRDRSVEIVRRYPQLILLYEQKPGPYAARNKGLGRARGALIAFTDADCAPSRDWLTRMCDGLTRTGAAIALGRRCFPRQGSVLRMCENYEQAKVQFVLSRCVPPRLLFAFTNNMALRASVVQALGPFAEWIRGADIEYVHRYLKQGSRDRIVYLPDMTVTHLELRTLNAWLGKQMTYGRSTRRIERKTPYRPLGDRGRFHVYRQCVRRNGYSVWQSACLFGVLALGALWFSVGRAGGMFEQRNGRCRSSP